MTFTPNIYYTLRLAVSVGGNWWAWVVQQGASLGVPLAAGNDAALATGGALASGKVGFHDYGNAVPSTRSYDNFLSWSPITDAAVFASKQAELRHNRFTRQDSTGSVWVDKAIEGDYLIAPPAGREGRTLRVFVKACRNDPTTGADSAIDDITAQLYYTPGYLALPE